jgi:hypothetical protein
MTKLGTYWKLLPESRNDVSFVRLAKVEAFNV